MSVTGGQLPLLQVRGLRTEFVTDSGTVRAVNDVDLALSGGKVLGVVGESGSGKSVTARSIMRMVHAPGRIVAGEILFDGRDLRQLSDEDMRRVRGGAPGCGQARHGVSLRPQPRRRAAREQTFARLHGRFLTPCAVAAFVQVARSRPAAGGLESVRASHRGAAMSATTSRPRLRDRLRRRPRPC
jgi:ABC-type branched-subunit amino acid transport system ATPase component